MKSLCTMEFKTVPSRLHGSSATLRMARVCSTEGRKRTESSQRMMLELKKVRRSSVRCTCLISVGEKRRIVRQSQVCAQMT
jgi:hypothetical protein